MAVVVFPTPPFWLAIAMTLPTRLPPRYVSPNVHARAEACTRLPSRTLVRSIERAETESGGSRGPGPILATLVGPVVGRVREQAPAAALIGPIAQRQSRGLIIPRSQVRILVGPQFAFDADLPRRCGARPLRDRAPSSSNAHAHEPHPGRAHWSDGLPQSRVLPADRVIQASRRRLRAGEPLA